MTTYSIPGPDGKTYTIDGPPGATRQQVIGKIQEQLKSKPEQSSVDQLTSYAKGESEAFGRAGENLFTMGLAQPVKALASTAAGKDYDTSLEKIKEEDDALAKQRPVATSLGGIAGLAGSLATGIGETELAGEGVAKIGQGIISQGIKNAPLTAGIGTVSGAANQPGNLAKKSEAGLVGGAVGLAAGFGAPAAGKLISKAAPAVGNAIQGTKDIISKMTSDDMSTHANDIVRNAVQSLKSAKPGIESADTDIYAASQNLTKSRGAAARPLYEKAFEGGSTAPLEKQFEMQFTAVNKAEADTLKQLHGARDGLTQAEARLSQAGDNVHLYSTANADKIAAEKNIEQLEKKLSGVRSQKDSIVEDLRGAQDDREMERKGGIYDPHINLMLSRPVAKEGLKEGLAIQADEAAARNEKFDPTEYAIKGQDENGNPIVGKVPNMRLLDAAKVGMDSMLEKYRNPNTGKLELDRRGIAIQELRDALVKKLDEHNPDYAAARAAWAGPSQSNAALWKGRSIFKPDSEVTEKYLSALSQSDRDFFKLGATRAIKDLMDKKTDGQDAIIKAFSTPLMKRKIDMVFDNKGEIYTEAQNAFADKLLEKSSSAQTDANKNPFFDLKKSQKFIEDHQDMINSGIFDENQKKTIYAITDLSKQSAQAPGQNEKVMDIVLSNAARKMMYRGAGALLGGITGHAAEGGAGAISGALAGMMGGGELANALYNAPPQKLAALVVNAIKDPEMAAALQTSPAKMTPAVQSKIMTFLQGTATAARGAAGSKAVVPQVQSSITQAIAPRHPLDKQQVVQ